MKKIIFDTPILLIIFNRPETTQKVFDAIRIVKPSRLYIAADGPRKDRVDEAEKCKAVRDIVKSVNWKCIVKTNYSNKNLGLRKRIPSAITWLFLHEEKGIILEDDCIPDLSFFPFCTQLLNRYENDERIMAISGNNFQFGKKRTDYGYYFSRYPHCWGWATWRRAWKYYDDAMKYWPEVKKVNWLKDILQNKVSELYWKKIFDLVYKNKIDSWAYRWLYSCWLQNGLAILPNSNLVSSIGFGNQATNAKIKSRALNLSVTSVRFPLKHPPFVVRDAKADKFTENTLFITPIVIGGLIYQQILKNIGIRT